MRFAVLGASQHVPALLEALQEHGLCEHLIQCGRWQPALSRIAPDAQVDSPWETLLDGLVDAVVVALEAGASEPQRDARAEQLRKLTGAGVAMLIVVPCCEGIVGYELDMIRRDTRALLFPYSPLFWHEGADRVAAQIDRPEAALGEIQQLVVERQMPPEGDAQRLQAFAQDAHLLERLLGPLAEFSASSSAAGTLDNFSAHFRGARLVARWSLLPGAAEHLSVSLIGAEGRAQWTVAAAGSTWDGPDGQQSLSNDAPRRAVASFMRQLDREAAEPSRWEGACRAAEAADNAIRSADRGRAVSMQEQTPTEEDTFKGMMAAGSCGLLLLTLLVLLIGGVVESVRFPALRNKLVDQRESQRQETGERPDSPPPAGALWLRLWPIYPFAAFLLLQLLRLVFLEPPRPSAAEQAAPAETSLPQTPENAGEMPPRRHSQNEPPDRS